MLLNPKVDTLLLACTHYPLLINKITQVLPSRINIVSQADIVAASLAHYLERHPQMERSISKTGKHFFYTTDSATEFDEKAQLFWGSAVAANHTDL